MPHTLREARDATLAAPTLLLPSIQVNIRAGRMPPAEDDGHTYLKIPVNRLGGASASQRYESQIPSPSTPV